MRFRHGPLEGIECQAGLLDLEDARRGNLCPEAARIDQLRDQKDIGQPGRITKAERARRWRQQSGKGPKPLLDCSAGPGGDRILRQAQVAQTQAQLKSAEAALRQSHLDVDDTIVRAGLDGRVGDSTVRVGQFAQPGTRLMTIVPIQAIYLVANFKETQIGRMRAGQPVTLHVDALPDLVVHGTVESFSPGTGAQFALLPSENATGNFTKIVQRVPVRIRVEADARLRERLLPGLSVTTEVDTRASAGARAADAGGATHG